MLAIDHNHAPQVTVRKLDPAVISLVVAAAFTRNSQLYNQISGPDFDMTFTMPKTPQSDDRRTHPTNRVVLDQTRLPLVGTEPESVKHM